MTTFDVMAFDADDTLWHTEHLFSLTQAKFSQLLSGYHDARWIEQRLYETEVRNLQSTGFGINGFILSMIETAIELTDGQIAGRDIQQIMEYAREMRQTPLQLLDHAAGTIRALTQSHRLMLITKGDLLDQESKIARSGLADYFTHIEIVSDKTPQTYEACLTKYRIAPSRFLMVGNSLKSDILPVVALGGQAVYIPYHTTWAYERVGNPHAHSGYAELEHIGQLPAWVEGTHTARTAR